MQLLDIFSGVREWGIFRADWRGRALPQKIWPTYPEFSRDEILSALPLLCQERGRLVRAYREARDRKWMSMEYQELTDEVEGLIRKDDPKSLARAKELILRRNEFRKKWDQERDRRREEEYRLDRGFAEVSDHIKVLINRLSGLEDA